MLSHTHRIRIHLHFDQLIETSSSRLRHVSIYFAVVSSPLNLDSLLVSLSTVVTPISLTTRTLALVVALVHS